MAFEVGKPANHSVSGIVWGIPLPIFLECEFAAEKEFAELLEDGYEFRFGVS